MRDLEEVPVDYARVLHDHSASPDEPGQVSFAKDDILDILNNTGDSWQVRKGDGTVGIIPSNLLVLFFGDLDPSTMLERLLLSRLRHQHTPSIDKTPSHIQSNGIPPATQFEAGPALMISPATVSVLFKAETLHSYTRQDPEDLSFDKGVVLDILDTDDEWWEARAPDGTIGVVPSNFMRTLEEAPTLGEAPVLEKVPVAEETPIDYARALCDYSVSPDNFGEVSFAKNDILEILDKNGDRWQVRKGDGTVGIVPFNLLALLLGDLKPSTVLEHLLSRLRLQQLPRIHRTPSHIQFNSVPPPPTSKPEVGPTPVTPSVTVPVVFKAKALYSYVDEDPRDLTFGKGVILDILDTEDFWWRARAPDGTIGTVPSDYMCIIDEVPVGYAIALYDYSASLDVPNEVSFTKGDILDVLSTNGSCWLVQKGDGIFGSTSSSVTVAPSNLLALHSDGPDPSTIHLPAPHSIYPFRPFGKSRERAMPVDRSNWLTPQGLVRMIAHLTSPGVNSWKDREMYLVHHVVRMNEFCAKEAVTALRRRFKYGAPRAQLLAIKLWACLTHHPSKYFVSEMSSRNFLDAVEDVLVQRSTNPVVRESILEVVASVAHGSGSGNDTPFQHLWRKYKSPDLPEEGVPLADDHPIFILVNFPEAQFSDSSHPATAQALFKAKARYSYTASRPSDISFTKGTTLDILVNGCPWSVARTPDGTVGTVHSHFVQMFPGFVMDPWDSLPEEPNSHARDDSHPAVGAIE
ncbi:Transmembrane osmosensor, partial [Marasmius tenuissimus]